MPPAILPACVIPSPTTTSASGRIHATGQDQPFDYSRFSLFFLAGLAGQAGHNRVICLPSARSSDGRASDGVVQHDRDMQQNSGRVEINGFSVELDGKGLKSCARVRRITFEVPKSPGSGSPESREVS
ncbi:hypothetical protein EV426DRAFT_578122 [Tirmania nivea]|nr:hypothetical protein EV426DRAFT_578122 [Tirmania nivea]